MTRRIAASMALVAFVVCILVGLQADNTFSTIVGKALLAMATTFILGLVIGTMAQKMLDENLAARTPAETNPKDSQAESGPSDR
jgi:hypothetical protein